jgi:hypothetical protein
MANYQGNSIVDYLASTGQANDFASRTKLATSKGISGYTGSAQQNTQLLNLLRGTSTPTPSGYTPSAPSTTYDGSALSSPPKSSIIPSPLPLTGQSTLQAKSDAIGLSTPTVYDPSKPLGTNATGLTATSSRADKVRARILTLAGIQGGQGEETAKLQEENKLAEKQKTLNDITNEYTTRQRAYEKQKRELERNPGAVSAAAANANISDLVRKGNEELADIAIRKSVAQGDVTTALDIVKTKIDAKYEPIKNEIQGLKDYLALNNNDLTESEQIQLQATIREKENAVNFQQQKDLIDYRAKIETESQAQGVDAPLYNGLSSKTATAVRSQVAAFKTEATVQNFNQVQEGYNFVKNLPTTTTNPADDQALIYSLAKVLDPGSVVREGEYATAQKYAQSWINAYGKGVSQALAGTGFLSEQPEQILRTLFRQDIFLHLQHITILQITMPRALML